MKTFKELSLLQNTKLKEAIILPNYKEIFYSNNAELIQEYYKYIVFDDSLKSIGAYNFKDKKLYINLSKINNNEEEFIKVIYHESIHLIQDKRTSNNMTKILINLKINKNFSKIKENFYFNNYFEVMAYASTYAIKCIIENKDIKKPNFTEIREFNILRKNKKFLKYVYLYYNELIDSSIVQKYKKEINEAEHFLEGMFQNNII